MSTCALRTWGSELAAFRVPGSWEEEGIKILRRYNVRYYGREWSLDEVAQQVVNS